MFRRICYTLGAIDLLLVIAHLLWPEYEWGQGRDSYFRFGNRLTFASWFASMQLVGVAALALTALHRERARRLEGHARTTWVWGVSAGVVTLLSIAEMTRGHERLGLLGYPNPDVYERMVLLGLGLGGVALCSWFLLGRLRTSSGDPALALGWTIVWSYGLIFGFVAPGLPERFDSVADLASGAAFLVGSTLLLAAVGGHALRAMTPAGQTEGAESAPVPYANAADLPWVFAGVAGSTFTIIFLQIVLFQMLNIFGDYLTANTVLSVALLGISVGALIGFVTAERAPLRAMIGASLMTPLAILVAFGTTVAHLGSPLLASVLLMLPFVCASVAITVALARSASHLIYAIDLVGAALGAWAVTRALGHFREEGSLLLLCAFALAVAACFVRAHPSAHVRRRLLPVVAVGIIGFVALGVWNIRSDALNIVRTKMEQRYPDLQNYFSRSSFVGRYDVIRTTPRSSVLKTIENGRIIDTVRPWTEEAYQVDPRLPHTLIDNPRILILGLSGDAITKTAKYFSDDVVGLEINPVVVDLQSGPMRELNGASYDGIDVVTLDGRTYVERSEGGFDVITLLNSHFAKGYVKGRSASPEYLQTVEAFEAYLDKMNDRGVVDIEEPVATPEREPQVWKLLVTMRQALINKGSPNPERHFFVFQWKTRRNNYFQVLMKKTPFTTEDLTRLKDWLHQVDVLPQTEAQKGVRLGPIKAITTVLYSPDGQYDTNCARIVEGRAGADFLRAHNLTSITDDRPFPFDLDPARRETKRAYSRTLLMALVLLPFFLAFLGRHRDALRDALPFVSIVSLTGMSYLLIEVVLIQRYAVFLGSPVVTFATVLGTLLIFSGVGSWWSARIKVLGLYVAVAGLFFVLSMHLVAVPWLLGRAAPLAMAARLALAIVSLAPLAFFMGIPFPFVLREGKRRFSEASAAMLFAINAATSALAVPLALNLSGAFGMRRVLVISLVVYVAVAVALVALRNARLLAAANISAYAVLTLLLVSPWLIRSPATAETDGEAKYEVYALSMGRSSHREDRVMQGGSSSRRVPFEWIFWLVRGEGRTILVDSGFDDAELARRWGIREFTPPVERLAELGVAPEDVTDLVLTHTHWDHAGRVDTYPNAEIYLQKVEYEHAHSVLGPSNSEGRGVRLEDLNLLDAAGRENRLNLISGRYTLAPGIEMSLGGSHTPGSQYVTVETRDGKVILAGDTTYLYWNNQRHVPIGTTVDAEDNLKTLELLQRLAGSPFLLMPGHDPRVMRWFPEVAEGVVRIAMEAP